MPVLPGNNAATYCPLDAIALTQAFGHGIPLVSVQANLCDVINSKIWCYYPWSWSVNQLTPVALVNGVQDYVALDTDILRPLHCLLTRTDLSPNEWREMKLLDNLSPELTIQGGLDSIRCIGYFAQINTFRFDRALNISTPATMELQGYYQVIPTKITEKNLQVPFLFPDRFYDCFVEGLKWKIYQLADDPRAGNITTDKRTGQQIKTGQLGVFFGSLEDIARTEDLGHGDEFSFPDAPLGAAQGQGWYGLYGY